MHTMTAGRPDRRDKFDDRACRPRCRTHLSTNGRMTVGHVEACSSSSPRAGDLLDGDWRSERAGKFVRAPDVEDQESSILFTAPRKRRRLNPGRNQRARSFMVVTFPRPRSRTQGRASRPIAIRQMPPGLACSSVACVMTAFVRAGVTARSHQTKGAPATYRATTAYRSRSHVD
jgi:hypothetical protein